MFVPRLSFEKPLEIHPKANEGGGAIVPPFPKPKEVRGCSVPRSADRQTYKAPLWVGDVCAPTSLTKHSKPPEGQRKNESTS